MASTQLTANSLKMLDPKEQKLLQIIEQVIDNRMRTFVEKIQSLEKTIETLSTSGSLPGSPRSEASWAPNGFAHGSSSGSPRSSRSCSSTSSGQSRPMSSHLECELDGEMPQDLPSARSFSA